MTNLRFALYPYSAGVGTYGSTVSGGQSNAVSGGYYGTVGGGTGNTMSNSSYATIPGGYRNVASGSYSLAAGNQARATNEGAFVWADSQNLAFASTGNDQFLIRAPGRRGHRHEQSCRVTGHCFHRGF